MRARFTYVVCRLSLVVWKLLFIIMVVVLFFINAYESITI